MAKDETQAAIRSDEVRDLAIEVRGDVNVVIRAKFMFVVERLQ